MGNLKALSRWLLTFSSLLLLGASDQAESLTEQQYLENTREFHSLAELESPMLDPKGPLQKDPKGAKARLQLVQAKLGPENLSYQTMRVLSNVEAKDEKNFAVAANYNISTAETDLAAKYPIKAAERGPDAEKLHVALTVEQSMSPEQLHSGIANADLLLIQGLIRDKRFDEALAAVEALEKKQVQNPAVFNLKGAIYLAKSDSPNARKSFERALALDATSADAAMNLAQLDLLEKNPEGARQRFQGILAKDATNFQAMMGLAGIAAATSQESEYVAWLERAAKAQPSAVRPRLLLANYYLQKNDVEKALVLAREAQTANPDDGETLDLLGTAQFAAGDKERAEATYSKMVKLLPESPIALYKLATVQAAMNKMSAMRVSLKNALALKPDYIDAEILLGSAELGAGRYADALKIAEQIQKQQPASASGFVLQGDILMAQKKFAPALKAYEKALEINKNGLITVKIYEALSAAGNVKDANARLVQWLNDRPADVSTRVYLAATYIAAKQTKQAIEQYEIVLQADPKNLRALNDLAWLYQQEKDPRALSTAERAYAVKPDNPEVMDTLGWILLEQNEAQRATKLLQKAAEMAPASTAIRYHWAAALAKVGDTERAHRELTELLTKHKNFPNRQEAQELLRQL